MFHSKPLIFNNHQAETDAQIPIIFQGNQCPQSLIELKEKMIKINWVEELKDTASTELELKTYALQTIIYVLAADLFSCGITIRTFAQRKLKHHKLENSLHVFAEKLVHQAPHIRVEAAKQFIESRNPP